MKDREVTTSSFQGSDSVRIVLRDRSDPAKFLILSEADDPGNMKLPGGKFESGEDEYSAAIRELLEEVNLDISKGELGEVIELLNDDGVSKRYIFHVEVDLSDVKPSEEISEIAWVDIGSIPSGKNLGHILAAVKSKDD